MEHLKIFQMIITQEKEHYLNDTVLFRINQQGYKINTKTCNNNNIFGKEIMLHM